MSGSMLATEKNVLIDVLQMYKEHRCLWDQTDLLYSNKEARKKALNLLLDKYKTVYTDSNIASLKRKIDSLRTSYKREKKKVIASIARGDDPCYQPTLWYFKLLSFIDCKSTSDSTQSVDQSSDCEDDAEDSSNKLRSRLLGSESSDHHNMVEEYINENDEYEIQYYDSDEAAEPKPKKPNLASVFVAEGGTNNQRKDTLLNDHGYTKKASGRASSSVEESEAFGRTVGLQLQQLDGFQRTVAEKLISEVIFYGRLNKLSANSFFDLNADKYN